MKPEFRNSKSERKAEYQNPNSSFELRISFGLRPSAFGLYNPCLLIIVTRPPAPHPPFAPSLPTSSWRAARPGSPEPYLNGLGYSKDHHRGAVRSWPIGQAAS